MTRLRGRYAEVLAEHQRVLRASFDAYHGREVHTEGDAFFVAFARARDAIAAAVGAQRALASQRWPEGVEVRVRIGVIPARRRSGRRITSAWTCIARRGSARPAKVGRC